MSQLDKLTVCPTFSTQIGHTQKIIISHKLATRKILSIAEQDGTHISGESVAKCKAEIECRAEELTAQQPPYQPEGIALEKRQGFIRELETAGTDLEWL